MTSTNTPALVPLTEGTLAWRITRERLIRRVQTGQVAGELRDGRWYVALPKHSAEVAAA